MDELVFPQKLSSWPMSDYYAFLPVSWVSLLPSQFKLPFWVQTVATSNLKLPINLFGLKTLRLCKTFFCVYNFWRWLVGSARLNFQKGYVFSGRSDCWHRVCLFSESNFCLFSVESVKLRFVGCFVFKLFCWKVYRQFLLQGGRS